jgi:hypothetical protein
MKHAGVREPAFDESRCTDPGGAIALAAAPKRFVPVPRNLDPERVESFDVRGDGVVREISAHHVTQPLTLISHRQVSSATKLVANCDKSHAHSAHGGVPVEQEPARPRPSADVREAEKIERVWLSLAELPSLIRRELAEADQLRLLGVQLQAESLQTIVKIGSKSSRSAFVLETQHDVVSVPHDDHVASCGLPSPSGDRSKPASRGRVKSGQLLQDAFL